MPEEIIQLINYSRPLWSFGSWLAWSINRRTGITDSAQYYEGFHEGSD